MAFNIDKMTLGEIAKIEELSGLPAQAMEDDNAPKGKLMAALAFVAKRREDPKFTWNQAMGLTFDEVNELLDLGDDEDDEAADEVARLKGDDQGKGRKAS